MTSLKLSSRDISIPLLAILAAGAICLSLLVSCGTSTEEVTETEIFYYACPDGVVIRAEQNTNENCLISIYNGKELITGRQLLRKDTAGWNYIGGDIAAMITDSVINVDFRNRSYEGCTTSPEERLRREYSDTLYYITNTGALIRLVPGDDSVVLKMSYGNNDIFNGSLPRVSSGSGEKFEEGNTMFWSKGNTAMFIHQGINYSHCIRMWRDEIITDPCSNQELNAFVTAFLTREYQDDLPIIPVEQRAYYAETYDLNSDGSEEVIIALRSPYFCGSGGCTWHIVAPDTTSLARVTVSQFPVYVSETSTNGYKDLHVSSGDTYHTLKFTDGAYPSNPSVIPVVQIFSEPAYTTAGTERLLEQAYQKSCPF